MLAAIGVSQEPGQVWSEEWLAHPVLYGNAEWCAWQALEREDGFIRYAAMRHSDGDDLLADDLAQAARLQLWDMDPSRFGPEDKQYVRRTLVLAMRLARRVARADGGGKRRMRMPAPVSGSDAGDEAGDGNEAPRRFCGPGAAESWGGICQNAGVQAVDERPRSLREYLEWMKAREA
jgi:hypothetical protein